MGFTDALIPMVFFVICIFGIATSSITIKTYLDTKKEKDTNFNFSAFILAASLIGLLVSGGMSLRAFRGGAVVAPAAGATAASELAGSKTNLGAQELGLANTLENVAANAASRAAKASEGAKLANALGATLGQLKQKGN